MLDNPNEEAFTLKWHETGNKTKGYRYAYPSSAKWKDETVHNKASALSKKGEVVARFKELQEQTSANHGITIDSLIEELTENRKAALGADTPQAGAANASTMGKARLCGLDIQRVETKEIVTDSGETQW